jgi:pimeloyl-ACP methyl ester carboxylesterase
MIAPRHSEFRAPQMPNGNNRSLMARHASRLRRLSLVVALLVGALTLTSCVAPVGADRVDPAVTYRAGRQNGISSTDPSPDTMRVLRRFDQADAFGVAPDTALHLIHQQALETHDRDLLFALSELSYLRAEGLRHSVKPWEEDARGYYLASVVYAWFFLFAEASAPAPDGFDPRFRTACDLYGYGLGWALAERRGTNAVASLRGGVHALPFGKLECGFEYDHFPWALEEFDSFRLADQFRIRGLSVHNRQPGLGAPLVAVSKRDPKVGLRRCFPATVFLRLSGDWLDLSKGNLSGSLELYSAFDATPVQIGAHRVPLETDTSTALAYGLNQSTLWRLGMQQFLSFKELVPTDIYAIQPYERGKIPVVFVHGTFSSPVWWAEMVNTLYADTEIQKHFQFWQFTYNSGNPTTYSAQKLRKSLTARLSELDPKGEDPALRQMVLIGHSQGGLLAKLCATDTGDTLLRAVLKTNRLEDLGLTPDLQLRLREYLCVEALPFIKRVVFISTPHRGSYLASSFTRRLARKFVTLPGRLVNLTSEFTGMTEKLELPKDLKGVPTSLDSMSPRNPVQLALAEIPLAEGIKGHSIIAVKGDGDVREGKDGVVAYESAHVDYVESELVVRGPHSCQGMPPTIEEVRRILRKHLESLPSAPSGSPHSP